VEGGAKEDGGLDKPMTTHAPQLYRDHFQNFKGYHIPRAQLVIADIPYNIGNNAYGSNPQWYVDGDNSKGESEFANSKFFATDDNFNIHEFMHFCSKLMKPEPKQRNDAACMIVFCSFEQQYGLIELARKFGINNYINLVFRKNFSAQVLKANMRVVGNAEYALLLYRDKLPKFRNNGKMVFNVMDWLQDDQSSPLYRKVHPTQKPIKLLERLIEIFTDPGDVVIDPVAGSGSTLLAAYHMGRKSFGFEIDRKLYRDAKEWLDFNVKVQQEQDTVGYSKTLMQEVSPLQYSLFGGGQ
jgi:site-specific DNA-methyltransferase (adenine-specific)